MFPNGTNRSASIHAPGLRRFLPQTAWTLFVLVITALPVAAKTHPVPLDKNVDAAKCLECHNSDDNREFGGTGPNGPHGSQYLHLLERRYEFSQVAPLPSGGPGTPIQNLFPTPILDPAANGPYSLCAKCHDLALLVSNTSFSEHARHINDGFSCSTCHNTHGMGSNSASISGERMVNFDINVVAPNGASPISYSRVANSCSLTCHGHAHTAVGASPAALNAVRAQKR